MNAVIRHENWARTDDGSIPTRKEECQFIDLWTGARFVREENKQYMPRRFRRIIKEQGTLVTDDGWVWRGGLHIPPVVWNSGSEMDGSK